jgi:transposase
VRKSGAWIETILVQAACYVPRDGVEYRDLGATYFDQRDSTNVVRRLKRRIEALGYEVEVRRAA